MKNQLWNKLFFGILMLFAASSFTACVDDNDDTGVPYLELEAETLPFTLQGGDVTFTVESNRPWFITMGENSDWVTVAPMAGDGTAEVEISLPEATYGRVAELYFHLSNSYGVYMTKTLSIQQGEVAAIETIYKETCGTASVSSPWPLVAAYSSWATEGTGADEVFYSGEKTSLRSSGLANAGSGPNVVFFGAAPASFVVNKIALQPEYSRLNLTFLGSFSQTLDNGDYNNTFDLGQFEVAISGDGKKWSKLDITKDNGDTERPYWVTAEADFSLVEVPDYLYIRFTASFSSAFRVDDIELKTSNDLGQEIDLSQGTEGGASGGDDGGDTPVVTDALWTETFGTPVKGDYWPYTHENTANVMAGSGVVAGTTAYKSYGTTARTVASQNSPNPPCSGDGHVWFPTGKTADNNYFMVEKVALKGATKLDVVFYLYGNSAAYKTGDVVLDLSGNGSTWTTVNFTTGAVPDASTDWVKAQASVTLKNAVDYLYVRFSSATTAGVRMDDPTLTVGNGGTEIDLENGTSGGDDPQPSDGPTSSTEFPGAGQYLLVASVDGVQQAATPVASDKTYGYLSPTAVSVSNRAVAADATTNALAWTVGSYANEGQFTIADPANRYYFMTGTYNSFNVATSVGSEGYNWVFTKGTDGLWSVVNVAMNKTLQYDTQYNSYGAYADQRGLLVSLYKLNDAKTAYELVGEGASDGGEEPTPEPGEDTSVDFTGAGNYMLVWAVGSKMKAALPASNYNLLAQDVVVENNTIAAAGNEAAVWRVVASAVEGQYTIQGSDNKYYAMKGDFDAFNRADDLTNGELSYEWVFRKQSDGRYMVLNVHKQKWMQWDETFNNVTASKQEGAMPYLFKANADGSAYELIGGGSTPDSGEEPTPEPEPTPSGVLSVKELVQLMIAGAAYTDQTVEGYVAAFGGSGAENVSQGTVNLTDNDGAEYSGLTVYAYDLSSLGLKVGDKIQVKLTNGVTGDYNGLRQLTKVTPADVTVISSGATINYKTLTGAQLNAEYAKYLSVPVQIANATPATASVGKTFATSLTFNDGTDFTVYNRSKWAAGAELTVHNVTATVRGVVSVYNGTSQLVPTSTADVEAFTQGGTTPDPDPTPDPEPDPTPDPSGTVYLWQDDFSQFDSKTADGTQDFFANAGLNGSMSGFTDAYLAGAKVYEGPAGKIKFGSSSVKGSLTTPAMKNIASGTVGATLSVDLMAWSNQDPAASTYGKIDSGVTVVITVNNGGTIGGAASVTTATLTGEMQTFTYTLSGVTSATTITIEAASASKKRFYLDNLVIKQQ